jgi:hypothetical protein
MLTIAVRRCAKAVDVSAVRALECQYHWHSPAGVVVIAQTVCGR